MVTKRNGKIKEKYYSGIFQFFITTSGVNHIDGWTPKEIIVHEKIRDDPVITHFIH